MNYLLFWMTVLGFVAVYTAIALLVMKHYAPEIPIYRLARIAVGAFSTTMLILIVYYLRPGRGPVGQIIRRDHRIAHNDAPL